MPRPSKRLRGIAAPPVHSYALAPLGHLRLQAISKQLPVIDYRGFPHIIETIVLYSSAEVLGAVRQTCRSLHRFVDDWFPRSITFDADGVACLPGAPNASLELIRWVDTHISTDVEEHGEEAALEAFERYQVCSCDGGVTHLRRDFDRILDLLDNVQLVRQDHTACPTSIPGTLDCVTFFDLTSAPNDEVVLRADGWETAISGKHVLHFLYSPNMAFPPLTEEDSWQYPDHSFVIIFSAIETDTVGQAQPLCTGDYRCQLYQGLLSFISDLVRYASGTFLRDNLFGPFVTFVGVETWDQTCIDSGIAPQHRRHRNGKMADLINDMIFDVLFDYKMRDSVEEVQEYLKFRCNVLFLSFDEYVP